MCYRRGKRHQNQFWDGAVRVVFSCVVSCDACQRFLGAKSLSPYPRAHRFAFFSCLVVLDGGFHGRYVGNLPGLLFPFLPQFLKRHQGTAGIVVHRHFRCCGYVNKALSWGVRRNLPQNFCKIENSLLCFEAPFFCYHC